MSSPLYSIRLVTWQAAESQLRIIRTEVFIHEQGVPEELEWDGEDPHAIHVLAMDAGGNPIGTARLLLHGSLAHIGRMAVLPAWRRQGVGAGLLQVLLDTVRQRGVNGVFLNAQTYAAPFYERFDFVREGEEFLDAGIPHYRMTLGLNP
ncbi:MAG: GNAT family N-acetyltransferase [Hydrogenophilales bacterium]|nr:GNAT family N-acetyltransferase [Hydrogenophilales bacterium]